MQELHGNVRVSARMRPFVLGVNVCDDAEPVVISKRDETGCVLSKSVDGVGKDCRDLTQSFKFDKWFPPRGVSRLKCFRD